MRTYTQLTEQQRYQIQVLLEEEYSQSEIADILGVHRTTIWRELNRNKSHRGYYRARDAHEICLLRHMVKPKGTKVKGLVRTLIRGYLRRDYSPEQVSGVLADYHGMKLSHETIYRFVIKDKVEGGTLYKHLRHRIKKHKRRYGSKNQRGHIKDRVMIDERPAIVERKSRIGDWEADTVVGKNHQGAIVTLVERKTKFTIVHHVTHRTADYVAGVIIALLRPYQRLVKTITCDNGKEFTHHARIAKALQCKVYFAHPFSSWERGLNENTNGLLRQYFPKGKSFSTRMVKQIKHAMERLNNRPRKILNGYTPNELFKGIPFCPIEA